MIKIALISDIHGNLLAFNEVLKDIKAKGISTIYCLGDLVDFAPWGNEVIEQIKHYNIPCLLGNHDERIAFDIPIHQLPHHDAYETENRTIAINHSKQNIKPVNKEFLTTLPYNITLTYKLGSTYRKVLLVHASLQSNDQYVYESDDKQEIYTLLENQGIDILVMGHTHQSYIQQQQSKLIINCGSVGRSKEQDRKATYAILTLRESNMEAEIVKIEYPIQQVAELIYESEIPNFYADFLLKKQTK